MSVIDREMFVVVGLVVLDLGGCIDVECMFFLKERGPPRVTQRG